MKQIKCQWTNCDKKAVVEMGVFGLDLCSKHDILGRQIAKEAQEWQEANPNEAHEQLKRAFEKQLKEAQLKKQV